MPIETGFEMICYDEVRLGIETALKDRGFQQGQQGSVCLVPINEADRKLILNYLGVDIIDVQKLTEGLRIPASQIQQGQNGVISINAQLHPGLNRILLGYILESFTSEEINLVISTINFAKQVVEKMDGVIRSKGFFSPRILSIKLDVGVVLESFCEGNRVVELDLSRGINLVNRLSCLLEGILSVDRENPAERSNDLLTNIISASVIKLDFWMEMLKKQLEQV